MKKFQYLIALAKHGHFGRAAEACHISQPAFSTAIQHLEEELGATLVQRGQRCFMGLTPAGEKILQRAQRLMDDWENLKQEAQLCKQELSGCIRIGAIPTALAVTALFTEAFHQCYPEITFKVFSLCAEQIFRQLDAYELDIGFSYLEDPRLQGFKVQTLYEERYVLLAREIDSNLIKQHTDWQNAASLPLCLLTPNRQLLDAAFRLANVKPKVVVETDSISALYAHVRCAGLYSIVPHSLLSLIEMRQEVCAIPIQPLLSREIGLAARKQDISSPLQVAAWQVAETLNLQQRFDSLINVIY